MKIVEENCFEKKINSIKKIENIINATTDYIYVPCGIKKSKIKDL